MTQMTGTSSALATARARLACLDPVDEPLLRFWRELLPDDFDPDDARKVISLDFELTGIERGKRSIERLAPFTDVAGKAVLDIGAGNGGLCIACAMADATSTAGIEIDETRIDLARQWAECRGVAVDFRQGVAEKLPFPDASFDVVFLSSVIEHVQDQERTIREMSRVLKPGGVFFLDGPNRLAPHWLREDPHYRIAGISAMPYQLGRWWVVDFLKISPSYDVGVFPIYSLLVRKLASHGLHTLHSDHNSYWLSVLTQPDRVSAKRKRTLLNVARALGVSGVVATVLRNTLPSFVIVGHKSV